MEKHELFPVTLNVYDVDPSLNRYLRPLGLGVYQTGVQVHNVEYTFWGRPNRRPPKIAAGWPRACRDSGGLALFESIVVGQTAYREEHVREIIKMMERTYAKRPYDLFARNGNHFSDSLCDFLTMARIPSWINRAAKIKWLSKRVLPVERLKAILTKGDDN